MNKELIKKYKAEFDHWLNNGKLLHKDEFGNWENTRDIWDLRSERIKAVVINDAFVEFRKALAEGKIVQEQDYYSKQWVDMKTDDFHRASDTQYEGIYRIKPEEPKFKVGDWVRNRINEIGQILQEDYKGKGLYKISNTHALKCEVGTSAKDLTIWVPKKGNWCWFSIKNRIPTIGQFLSIEADGNRKYSATFPNTPHPFITYYDYCEPFIGNLPTLSNK